MNIFQELTHLFDTTKSSTLLISSKCLKVLGSWGLWLWCSQVKLPPVTQASRVEALLLTHLPANMPGKVVEDGPKDWTPVTHLVDPHGVSGPA